MKSNGKLIVAVDGPAGSGKSSVARAVAQKLGYTYLDSGAIYRCVGLEALRRNIAETDSSAIAGVASSIRVDFQSSESGQKTLLFGNDVTEEIRKPEVSSAASKVSALPAVRAALMNIQKEIGKAGALVAEGRDMGTVVFTNADVKIFLTADVKERAKRRYEQLISKGHKVSFDEIVIQMKERDERDSRRDIAPMKPADDAINLDTSQMSLQEVIDFVYKKCLEKIG